MILTVLFSGGFPSVSHQGNNHELGVPRPSVPRPLMLSNPAMPARSLSTSIITTSSLLNATHSPSELFARGASSNRDCTASADMVIHNGSPISSTTSVFSLSALEDPFKNMGIVVRDHHTFSPTVAVAPSAITPGERARKLTALSEALELPEFGTPSTPNMGDLGSSHQYQPSSGPARISTKGSRRRARMLDNTKNREGQTVSLIARSGSSWLSRPRLASVREEQILEDEEKQTTAAMGWLTISQPVFNASTFLNPFETPTITTFKPAIDSLLMAPQSAGSSSHSLPLPAANEDDMDLSILAYLDQ